MAAAIIGKVNGECDNTYEVKWDEFSKEIFVKLDLWTFVGKAPYPGEALKKAEEWVKGKQL